MGNPEHQLKNTKSLIRQIRSEIPASDFFELGDNQSRLDKIDELLERISGGLASLEDSFAGRPFPETNLYLRALKAVRAAQEYIGGVRRDKGGSTDHTRHFLQRVRALEEAIESLDGVPAARMTASAAPGGESASVLPVKTQPRAVSVLPDAALPVRGPSRLAAAAGWIIHLPYPIGRFIYDTINRKEVAESSAIIMGWIVILFGVLLYLGRIPLAELFDIWLAK